MAEQQAQVLRESRDGDIAILTLDNPARRNALSLEMRLKLTEALRRLDGDEEVRALVLTGTGGHFCAGGDIAGQGSGSGARGVHHTGVALQNLVGCIAVANEQMVGGFAIPGRRGG